MLGEDDARSALAAESGRLLATRSALRRERPNDSRETDAKDVSEVGAEMAERTEETLLLDELDADLEAVDAAVVRLDTVSTGGACDLCGGPICDDRPQALPAARTCVVHRRRGSGRI